ncbi:hypothetical protein WJX72_000984 [[Myrmecia] bisecta]|uniref:Calcineurin-like phosphoesterase domain-containing protein n=1 Tax=[Myrmecia] bisecta TaxID=41462 RepID=A0AAW1PZE6_9CHLO
MAAPLFSFGVVADTQYGDLEDTHDEGRTQRYREVPAKLQAAVADWTSSPARLAFILTLGDIIQGNTSQAATQADLDVILGALAPLAAVPVHHVLGNHCLSLARQSIQEQLGIPASYYMVQLPAHWRLIVLDTTEMSGHSGYPETSQQGREAKAYQDSHPMSERDRQMASWNGGIASEQMKWLQGQLHQAKQAGEQVIMACHHQFGQGAARPTHYAWNWREISQVTLDSSVVRLVLCGHDHEGGNACHKGTHFVTLEAMLEAPPDSNAYATVDIFNDRIQILGQGSVTSRNLTLQ